MSRLRRNKAHRNSKFSSSLSKRLRFESLEQKNLLAGDVAISVVGGDMFVVGDTANNDVQVVGTATPGEFTFSDAFGGGTTTFNGLSTLTVGGVTGDITVDMGGGNNLFDIINTSLPGSFSAHVGSDFDVIRLGTLNATGPRETIAGDLNLVVDNTLAAFVNIGLDVGGDVSLSGTPLSGDSLLFENMSIGGNFDISLDAVISPISIDNVESVGGDVNISGNFLDFRVNNNGGATSGIPMLVGGDFNVTASGQDDVFDLFNIDVTGDFRFDGGDGANDVTITQLIADDIFVTDGIDAGAYVLDGVTAMDDLRIKAGAGGVSIEATALTIGDDLAFKGGDGNDEFFVDTSTIGDDLYARGRDGLDDFSIEDVTVGDKLRFSTGAGDDTAFIVESTIGRSALISLGSGFNESEIEGVDAGRSLTVLGRGTNNIFIDGLVTTHFVTIVTASGDDVINMQNVNTYSAMISTNAGEDIVSISESNFDYLFVFLGSGDDALTLDNVTVDRFAFLHGGSGDDSLIDVDDESDINFELDFAFETYGT